MPGMRLRNGLNMNWVSNSSAGKRIVSSLAIAVCIWCQSLIGTPRSIAQEQLSPPTLEQTAQTWVGWLESPESHLRWIVRIKKNAGEWSGSIQLPDRINSAPIPMSKLNVSDKDLSFTWQPANEAQEASYVGNIDQSGIAKGLILQGDNSVFSQLKRIDQWNEESADTLGADSVWIDQTRARAKVLPYDLRLRIYSSGPFFDGSDRILLDSQSSKILGAPVKLTQSEGTKWSFQVPSLKVEYVAELAPSGETLSGFLTGNANSKPLQLYNWSSQTKTATAPGEKDSASTTSNSKTESVTAKNSSSMQPTDKSTAESVKIKLNEPKPTTRVSKDGEDEFLLTVATPGGRTKNDRTSHQLGCTLKLPDGKSNSKIPLAILVSTFDSQERDGIVGNSRIYKQLAINLAEKGIATIRFDDRGTGSSTPASPSYSLPEAAADLRAVLDYAKGLDEVDKTKIGFIGHGFGASLSTQLAAVDPSVAFLVCLAPPALNGSQLLLDELRKTSELEQLDENSLTLLVELQRDLHALAQKPIANETQMNLEFDDLFRIYWPRIESTIPKPNAADNESGDASIEQIKLSIEEKLKNDLVGLQSRFNREFLRSDPSSTWMILQTPTLAIWGSKDVQVDAEKNKAILNQALRRNTKNRVRLMVLPNLNHLFQECETGLPSEYQQLGTNLSSSAITAIVDWLREQRITSK